MYPWALCIYQQQIGIFFLFLRQNKTTTKKKKQKKNTHTQTKTKTKKKKQISSILFSNPFRCLAPHIPSKEKKRKKKEVEKNAHSGEGYNVLEFAIYVNLFFWEMS